MINLRLVKEPCEDGSVRKKERVDDIFRRKRRVVIERTSMDPNSSHFDRSVDTSDVKLYNSGQYLCISRSGQLEWLS